MMRRSRISIKPNFRPAARSGSGASQPSQEATDETQSTNVKTEDPGQPLPKPLQKTSVEKSMVENGTDSPSENVPVKVDAISPPNGSSTPAAAPQRRMRFSAAPKLTRPKVIPSVPRLADTKPDSEPSAKPKEEPVKIPDSSPAPINSDNLSDADTPDRTAATHTATKSSVTHSLSSSYCPLTEISPPSPQPGQVPQQSLEKQTPHLDPTSAADTPSASVKVQHTGEPGVCAPQVLAGTSSDRERILRALKLKELMKIERRKDLKRTKRGVQQQPQCFDAVDHSKMTMRDLIYYLPNTSPMKSSQECEESRVETVAPLPPHVTEREEEDEEDEQSENEDMLVPKVRVAEDGSLVLDEDSLTVRVQRTSNTKVVEDSNPLFERGSTTTYASFRTVNYVKNWSVRETDMFFLAISMVGTDFSLIGHLFPHRCRRELKNKFKKEERVNSWRIDKAFRNKRPYDREFFSFLLEKVLAKDKEKRNSVKLVMPKKPRKARGNKSKHVYEKDNSDVNDEDVEHVGAEKENEDFSNMNDGTVTAKKGKRKRKVDDDPAKGDKGAEDQIKRKNKRSRKNKKEIQPAENDANGEEDCLNSEGDNMNKDEEATIDLSTTQKKCRWSRKKGKQNVEVKTEKRSVKAKKKYVKRKKAETEDDGSAEEEDVGEFLTELERVDDPMSAEATDEVPAKSTRCANKTLPNVGTRRRRKISRLEATTEVGDSPSEDEQLRNKPVVVLERTPTRSKNDISPLKIGCKSDKSVLSVNPCASPAISEHSPSRMLRRHRADIVKRNLRANGEKEEIDGKISEDEHDQGTSAEVMKSPTALLKQIGTQEFEESEAELEDSTLDEEVIDFSCLHELNTQILPRQPMVVLSREEVDMILNLQDHEEDPSVSVIPLDLSLPTELSFQFQSCKFIEGSSEAAQDKEPVLDEQVEKPQIITSSGRISPEETCCQDLGRIESVLNTTDDSTKATISSSLNSKVESNVEKTNVTPSSPVVKSEAQVHDTFDEGLLFKKRPVVVLNRDEVDMIINAQNQTAEDPSLSPLDLSLATDCSFHFQFSSLMEESVEAAQVAESVVEDEDKPQEMDSCSNSVKESNLESCCEDLGVTNTVSLSSPTQDLVEKSKTSMLAAPEHNRHLKEHVMAVHNDMGRSQESVVVSPETEDKPLGSFLATQKITDELEESSSATTEIKKKPKSPVTSPLAALTDEMTQGEVGQPFSSRTESDTLVSTKHDVPSKRRSRFLKPKPNLSLVPKVSDGFREQGTTESRIKPSSNCPADNENRGLKDFCKENMPKEEKLFLSSTVDRLEPEAEQAPFAAATTLTNKCPSDLTENATNGTRRRFEHMEGHSEAIHVVGSVVGEDEGRQQEMDSCSIAFKENLMCALDQSSTSSSINISSSVKSNVDSEISRAANSTSTSENPELQVCTRIDKDLVEESKTSIMATLEPKGNLQESLVAPHNVIERSHESVVASAEMKEKTELPVIATPTHKVTQKEVVQTVSPRTEASEALVSSKHAVIPKRRNRFLKPKPNLSLASKVLHSSREQTIIESNKNDELSTLESEKNIPKSGDHVDHKESDLEKVSATFPISGSSSVTKGLTDCIGNSSQFTTIPSDVSSALLEQEDKNSTVTPSGSSAEPSSQSRHLDMMPPCNSVEEDLKNDDTPCIMCPLRIQTTEQEMTAQISDTLQNVCAPARILHSARDDQGAEETTFILTLYEIPVTQAYPASTSNDSFMTSGLNPDPHDLPSVSACPRSDAEAGKEFVEFLPNKMSGVMGEPSEDVKENVVMDLITSSQNSDVSGEETSSKLLKSEENFSAEAMKAKEPTGILKLVSTEPQAESCGRPEGKTVPEQTKIHPTGHESFAVSSEPEMASKISEMDAKSKQQSEVAWLEDVMPRYQSTPFPLKASKCIDTLLEESEMQKAEEVCEDVSHLVLTDIFVPATDGEDDDFEREKRAPSVCGAFKKQPQDRQAIQKGNETPLRMREDNQKISRTAHKHRSIMQENMDNLDLPKMETASKAEESSGFLDPELLQRKHQLVPCTVRISRCMDILPHVSQKTKERGKQVTSLLVQQDSSDTSSKVETAADVHRPETESTSVGQDDSFKSLHEREEFQMCCETTNEKATCTRSEPVEPKKKEKKLLKETEGVSEMVSADYLVPVSEEAGGDKSMDWMVFLDGTPHIIGESSQVPVMQKILFSKDAEKQVKTNSSSSTVGNKSEEQATLVKSKSSAKRKGKLTSVMMSIDESALTSNCAPQSDLALNTSPTPEIKKGSIEFSTMREGGDSTMKHDTKSDSIDKESIEILPEKSEMEEAEDISEDVIQKGSETPLRRRDNQQISRTSHKHGSIMPENVDNLELLKMETASKVKVSSGLLDHEQLQKQHQVVPCTVRISRCVDILPQFPGKIKDRVEQVRTLVVQEESGETSSKVQTVAVVHRPETESTSVGKDDSFKSLHEREEFQMCCETTTDEKATCTVSEVVKPGETQKETDGVSEMVLADYLVPVSEEAGGDVSMDWMVFLDGTPHTEQESSHKQLTRPETLLNKDVEKKMETAVNSSPSAVEDTSEQHSTVKTSACSKIRGAEEIRTACSEASINPVIPQDSGEGCSSSEAEHKVETSVSMPLSKCIEGLSGQPSRIKSPARRRVKPQVKPKLIQRTSAKDKCVQSSQPRSSQSSRPTRKHSIASSGKEKSKEPNEEKREEGEDLLLPSGPSLPSSPAVWPRVSLPRLKLETLETGLMSDCSSSPVRLIVSTSPSAPSRQMKSPDSSPTRSEDAADEPSRVSQFFIGDIFTEVDAEKD